MNLMVSKTENNCCYQLYGHVVPMARDLLLQGVVVHHDVLVVGLCLFSCLLLSVGLHGLVGSGVTCELVL